MAIWLQGTRSVNGEFPREIPRLEAAGIEGKKGQTFANRNTAHTASLPATWKPRQGPAGAQTRSG